MKFNEGRFPGSVSIAWFSSLMVMCFSAERKTLPILKAAKLRNLGKNAGEIQEKWKMSDEIVKREGKVLI